MSTEQIKRPGNYNDIDNMLVNLIATSQVPISRTDLQHSTTLSKMTISKHIAHLIERGIVSEAGYKEDDNTSMGRRQMALQISDQSPLICGVYLRRDYCRVILTDISCKIVSSETQWFQQDLTAEKLVALMRTMIHSQKCKTKRTIVGCGISTFGPVNSKDGCIISPPNFFGIEYVELTKPIEDAFQIPTILVHDVSGSAVAEQVFGNAKSLDDFLQIHLQSGNGIGSEVYLNGSFLNLSSGRGGEIGHTSINCFGEYCNCGKRGCLDQYANLGKMQEKLKDILPMFRESKLANITNPSWDDILKHAAVRDPAAMCVLEEFCEYLAVAVSNCIRLFGVSNVVIAYDRPLSVPVIERLVKAKLERTVFRFREDSIRVVSSYFGGDGPLIGAVAVIAQKIFKQEIII